MTIMKQALHRPGLCLIAIGTALAALSMAIAIASKF